MTRAKPTGHVVIAYGLPGLRAHVAPCIARCGVWAVATSQGSGATYELVHAPSGAVVRSFTTNRAAARVCKRLGEACGLWAFDCGFGDAPEMPAKVARLSGARAVERVV